MIFRLKFQVKRMARRLTWSRPALYFPFGIVRNRGNVFRCNYQLYLGGYPRSANTFAAKAWLSANPGTTVKSHRHIPAFVVQAAKRKTPGMVLIRNPIDAVISWAIYTEQPLPDPSGGTAPGPGAVSNPHAAFLSQETQAQHQYDSKYPFAPGGVV